tara:strand:+ start:204 stop:383 length:180 start_codon:yes stop_codon:yes gene_type:complete
MTNKFLQDIFLDWINNYLTRELFAEHNELTIKEATILIELGRSVHERLVIEYKESLNDI